MKKIYITILLLTYFSISHSQSVIVIVDRSNIVGPTQTGTDPQIGAVGLTRGSGVTLTSNSKHFTSGVWNGSSQAEAETNNEYIQWSVVAGTDNTVEITQLDIKTRINANGPANFQIFYSLDNFSTAGIAVTSVQNSPNPSQNFTFDSLSINSGIGGVITFRLYAWNAVNNNGYFRIGRRGAWAGLGIDDPGLRMWGNISFTGINSNESNIVSTAFDPQDNIDYTLYSATSGLTTANAIKIGEMTIQDGGDDNLDSDILPTILTDIAFDVTGFDNLAAVALFDGTTNVGEVTSVTDNIVFNSINSGTGISAPDNGTYTFDIYATFDSTVLDNQQIVLQVSGAFANAVIGSSFETFDAGGATTSTAGDDNRIEVVATKLEFIQNASDVSQFVSMVPSPLVEAVDGNNNRDRDYTGTVVMTTDGTFDPSAVVTFDAVLGEALFGNLIFSEQGSGFQIIANDAGLALSSVISDFFDVLEPPFDGLIFSNNVWSPNPPSASTGSDDALLLDGVYTITSDIELNNVIMDNNSTINIQPGKSLVTNGDLESNGNLNLRSTGIEYSSLIVNGSITGGDINYSRHVNNTAAVGENDLISAPVTGEAFDSFRSNNPNIHSNQDNTLFLFGPFDKATASYVLYSDTETAPLTAGTGYRSASTDDGNFDFTGVANTGNVDVDVEVSGPSSEEWNLIGNPYPSYLSLSAFLAANADQFDPDNAGVYGYDGDASNGFVVWNQAYSDANPNAIIAPGQGFFIAAAGNRIISFTPSMRAIGSDDDFIPGFSSENNDIAHLKLRLESNTQSYNTEFYFTPKATLGHDPGYDSGSFGGTAPSDFAIYSRLVQDKSSMDMITQSIGQKDINGDTVIPIGINASQGEQITVRIAKSTLSNIDVYLEDTVENTSTLLNSLDYVFTPTTDLSGVGRFNLRFEKELPSEFRTSLNSLNIYNLNFTNRLVINGELTDDSSLLVYDIQGRLIFNENLETGNGSRTIELSGVTSGIYIAKVSNGQLEKSQKIIIK